MYTNKKILITGGTGSFGKKFIEKALELNAAKVIIFSRDELKQYELQKLYADKKDELNRLRFFIGDVRDLERLKRATENVDIVVHAAALKQVPAAEYNPFEAVKTNIIGAHNVIEACMYNDISKVLALSTDKAAAPINLYGATKLTSDKLFIAANNYKGSKDIRFSVVRYGNVFGSRGSVVPFFLNQLNKTGIFPITDKAMTRFSITLSEGVNFVNDSINIMKGGELFVPKLPSYRVIDVANAISDEAKIEIVGIRPGEKLHEEMITETDSLNTIELEKFYVIKPSIESKILNDIYNEKKVEFGFSYNSLNNKNFLTIEQIKSLITKEL